MTFATPYPKANAIRNPNHFCQCMFARSERDTFANRHPMSVSVHQVHHCLSDSPGGSRQYRFRYLTCRMVTKYPTLCDHCWWASQELLQHGCFKMHLLRIPTGSLSEQKLEKSVCKQNI